MFKHNVFYRSPSDWMLTFCQPITPSEINEVANILANMTYSMWTEPYYVLMSMALGDLFITANRLLPDECSPLSPSKDVFRAGEIYIYRSNQVSGIPLFRTRIPTDAIYIREPDHFRIITIDGMVVL